MALALDPYSALTHRVPIYQEPIRPVVPAPTHRVPIYQEPLHPAARAAPAARAPATGGMPTLEQLYRQVMGTIETPAQMEARANREVEAQMAAQQKMLNETSVRERADALAAMQAQDQAGAAAAAMSKGLIGSVGGEYNAAAQEISGLAGGLTGSFNAATSGEIKAANKALGNLGAPSVQVGGVGGIGGGLQAGVENYRGGTIPSQLFTQEGDAATFGLAGQTAAQNLKMTQEAQAAYQSTVHDINQNEQKAVLALAAQRPELAHQYLTDAQTARTKAISLAQGMIAMKQAQAQAAVTAKINAIKLAQAQQKITNTATYQQGSLGVRKAAIQSQNARSAAAISAQNSRSANSLASQEARSQWGITSRESIASLKAQQTQLTQMVAAGAIDTNRSRALGYVVNKAGKPVLGPDGKRIPAWRLSVPKTMTPGQVQKLAERAETSAASMFYGMTKDAKGKVIPATMSPGFNPDDAATYGTQRVKYTAALGRLLRQKVPEQAARSALNAYYERGDQQRPFFSPQEKAALQRTLGAAHYTGLLNTLNRFREKYYNGDDTAWEMLQNVIQQNLAKIRS